MYYELDYEPNLYHFNALFLYRNTIFFVYRYKDIRKTIIVYGLLFQKKLDKRANVFYTNYFDKRICAIFLYENVLK